MQSAQFDKMRDWLKTSHTPDTRWLSEHARYGYIPGLDGLRAVAVLIVIAAHFGLGHIVPGGFGVTVFFFISGFLITRLLIAEHQSQGQIGLQNFYLRRLLRLVPALVFMVFGSTLYFMMMGYGGPTLTELFAALFYFTNIYQVAEAAKGGAMPFMSWTHLWSLAVEEHFYLLFPLIVMACGALINRLTLSIVIILVGVPIWRFVTATYLGVSPENYNYMMTDARIDSIAWGCLLTTLLHQVGEISRFRRLIGLLPFGAALFALLMTFIIQDESFRYIWRFTVQGAALFVLFLNFYYMRGLQFSVEMMEFPVLKWLGQVSYGLYLWHFPIIDASERLLGTGIAAVIVALIATLAITAFSFYYVERPFNAMRKTLKSPPKKVRI